MYNIIKKNLVGVIVLAVVALGASIWFFQKQGKLKEFSGAREAVTFGFTPELNFLAIIALQEGYLKNEGLDITVKEYSTGKRVLRDGLLNGEIDVGIAGFGPLAFESFKREDFKIFGTLATFYDLYKIAARKDKGVQQPGDLMGKRIGTSKRSSFHFFLHNFLIEKSLFKEDIQVHFKQAHDLPIALANGELDAFCTREPYISQAIKLLGDKVIIFSEPQLPSNAINLVALNSFIDNHPDVMKKMLKALINAENFAREHPDRAFKIVLNKLEIDEFKLADLWAKTELKVSLDQELIISLENIARWAIADHLIEKKEIPNYLDYIYLKGLDDVKPEAVTIIR